MTTTGDLFWSDDPSILISSKRMTQFFPNKSFTLNEKLNSLVRLGMYCSIILIAYDKDIKWTSVFIFALLFTYYLKYYSQNNIKPAPLIAKPVNNVNHHLAKINESQATAQPTTTPIITGTGTPVNTMLDSTTTGAPLTTTTSAPVTTTTSDPVTTTTSAPVTTTSIPLTTTGPSVSTKTGVPLPGVSASNDFIETLENCVAPTLDNPFMNMTMKDYLNTDKSGNIIERNPACDPNDPNIKKSIDAKFNNNLYRDVSDVFGKYNSQRQYFTMPWTQTIPDVDGNFKNWLYKSPKTCKENNNCIRYEDIRTHRQI